MDCSLWPIVAYHYSQVIYLAAHIVRLYVSFFARDWTDFASCTTMFVVSQTQAMTTGSNASAVETKGDEENGQKVEVMSTTLADRLANPVRRNRHNPTRRRTGPLTGVFLCDV